MLAHALSSSAFTVNQCTANHARDVAAFFNFFSASDQLALP
jgi:hypothetical protein